MIALPENEERLVHSDDDLGGATSRHAVEEQPANGAVKSQGRELAGV